MKITIAYNLRDKNNTLVSRGMTIEDVERFYDAVNRMGYMVSKDEVSGKPDRVIERLLYSDPDLIFNLAEGTIGTTHKAFYPALYEQLDLPYTGPDSSLLYLLQDRFLANTIMSSKGILLPGSAMITPDSSKIPDHLRYPLIIKPNARYIEKGIKSENLVSSEKEAYERIRGLMDRYPAGLIVEEFIKGREMSIPILESYRGQILGILEYAPDQDLLSRMRGHESEYDSRMHPAEIGDDLRHKILGFIEKIHREVRCPDLSRVDICISEDGNIYLIEINPMPSLRHDGLFMQAAQARELTFKDVVKLIIRSASHRFNLSARKSKKHSVRGFTPQKSRSSARELGITVGRFPTGKYNAITDIRGVKVGHITYMEDNVEIPGMPMKTSVRTGVTAIIPGPGSVFTKRMVAGGFVLNGVGEMAGLTQVLEWGWLESPIMLCNTMSVGRVHSGVVTYMQECYREMSELHEVILPVVGETDDSYLNDIRVRKVTPADAKNAILSAKSGPVPQGSVGAGTGMTTFDFAGGIGTSSRILPEENGGYMVGVLVLSNFGNMRNLTIEGSVVGRELDKMYSKTRRKHSYGSIIVVVATDAPLLSSQLNRISKRAALGLGRVGSHAGYTSGEIIIAFSTGNRTPREEYGKTGHLTMKFITDSHLNPMYEAVIEATEEAVLNAIFCSGGMKGRDGNESSAIPHEKVLELLGIRMVN